MLSSKPHIGLTILIVLAFVARKWIEGIDLSGHKSPSSNDSFVKSDIGGNSYKDLWAYDELIESVRKGVGTELRNPLFWGRLGQLYFDRYRIWKQDGLAEALECLTMATSLFKTIPSIEENKPIQLAMVFQSGVILTALGHSKSAIEMYDTALKLSGDSIFGRANILNEKATTYLTLSDIQNITLSVELLNESSVLNPCNTDTHWKLVVAMKELSVRKQTVEEWGLSGTSLALLKLERSIQWNELFVRLQKLFDQYFVTDNLDGYYDRCQSFLDWPPTFNYENIENDKSTLRNKSYKHCDNDIDIPITSTNSCDGEVINVGIETKETKGQLVLEANSTTHLIDNMYKNHIQPAEDNKHCAILPIDFENKKEMEMKNNLAVINQAKASLLWALHGVAAQLEDDPGSGEYLQAAHDTAAQGKC